VRNERRGGKASEMGEATARAFGGRCCAPLLHWSKRRLRRRRRSWQCWLRGLLVKRLTLLLLLLR
jgi:hypothetical protein